MELPKWPILDHREGTQSNTYIPLICSVIEGFKMDFPTGYEGEFFAAVHEYNRQAPFIGEPPLTFTNLKTFQTFLKTRVERVIGGLSIGHFFEACDHDSYHIKSHIQERIMHGLDGFFNIFIPKLIAFGRIHRGVTCDLSFSDAPAQRERKPHRVVAHTTRADRTPHRVVNSKWYAMDKYGRQEDYSDEVNRQINEQIGRDDPPFMTTIHGDTYLIDPNGKIEENVSTKQQRVILKKDPILSPRWYYPDDYGNLTPYPDHINDEIMKTKKGEGLLINIHGIDYFINTLSNSQINSRTGESRRIVYEGGNKKTKRTKRRRSLYKYTRHHA